MSELPAPTPAAAPVSSLALQQISLFSGLPTATMDRIAAQCQWHRVAANAVVAERTSDRVYFLLTGEVMLSNFAANGRQVNFLRCSPGDYFGLISALDGQSRIAHCVASTDAVLASLSGRQFRDWLHEEPVLAERTVHMLVRMVRGLAGKLMDVSARSVPERLHAHLLRQAEKAGVEDNQARLRLPPQTELASFISTTREPVARELGRLTREGLLRKQGRLTIVTDVTRLRALVSPDPDAPGATRTPPP